eukprot:9154764-Prorocentrum_lima.AAC.1
MSKSSWVGRPCVLSRTIQLHLRIHHLTPNGQDRSLMCSTQTGLPGDREELLVDIGAFDNLMDDQWLKRERRSMQEEQGRR